MFGKATLEIPENGFCGPVKIWGLSDELASIMGRTAAWTLSDKREYVIVTLSDGTIEGIGQNPTTGELVITPW